MKTNTSFTIFCTIIILTTTILGTWQIIRLNYKNKLLNQIHTQSQKIPTQIENINPNSKPTEFTPITLTAHWNNKQIFLIQSKVKNETIGLNLWRIANTPKWKQQIAIPINLGWVNKKFKLNKNSPKSQKITGLIRYTQKPNPFIPNNNPNKNIWYSPNLKQMQTISKTKLTQFYISTNNNFWHNIPNNHLQYAITWYSLTCTFIILLIIKLQRKQA